MADDVVRFFGVPERLELDDGVVVRRYVETDIPALVDVVNANLDHLRPWMPWAQGPVSVDSQLEFFRDSEKQWDEGVGFVYGIFAPDGRVIGGTGYHVRNGPGVLEIGYWLVEEATGRGLMTRLVGVLTDAACKVEGVASVEIHCDAGNARSAAIPKRLGYALVRTEPREVMAPAETGTHLIWAIAAQP